MKPYYQDEGVVLYNSRCEDILSFLEPEVVDLVLTDPPYGIAEKCDRKSRKRTALAECNDFPQIRGDEKPFNPALLLRFPRLVLFGANYYAERLPASSSWIVWDKLDGLTSKREIGFNDNADAELAWTNLGGPVRLVPHRWMGMLKASERAEKRVHPTQKPVALMEWVLRHWTQPGDLILDPYAGSGSTLVAARNLNRRVIGVEMEERYCEVIVNRLGEPTLAMEA